MVGRLYRSIGPAILSFITYIVFSGSLSTYDVVTGIIVSLTVGYMVANITIANPKKLLELGRLVWLLLYAIYYFFIAEVRAHIDVIGRILHPRMPINPGIVRVPYHVETDYAMTAIANSITNTPGTVVVDVDTKRKIFYVHWINVISVKPEVAFKSISEAYEKYAKKVFD